MSRLIAVGLALALGLSTLVATAQASEPIPFQRGSWAKLAAAHAGRPTVVHFWGLTCAPCIVELPQWGKLRAERPDLRLVLVSADPVPQPVEQVTAALQRAGLGTAESWAFTDRFNERLRFEIDPAWSGELPRTVLVAADGTATVLPGVADLSKVRAWLDAQPRPRR
jgi:thiol-disulfide isomerase/thioredoxin